MRKTMQHAGSMALTVAAIAAISAVPSTGLALPYGEVAGIWQFDDQAAGDNGRLRGRLLLLSDYGELNVDIRRTSSDSDVVGRSCNYIFKKSADTAEAQTLHLVPDSSTTNFSNSDAECSNGGALTITEIDGMAMRAAFTDDHGTYSLPLVHALGAASHDSTPYMAAITRMSILATDLSVPMADFVSSITAADPDYQHVEGRDTLEYGDEAWAFSVLYARKPPVTDDNDREQDADSIAAYFQVHAPDDAGPAGTGTPVLMRRWLTPTADDTIGQTVIADALKDKYGEPSYERSSSGRRQMTWIFDRGGAQIEDDRCPDDRNAMNASTRYEFVDVGGQRHSFNFSPLSTCTVSADVELRFDDSSGLISEMTLHVYDQALMRYDVWRQYDLENNPVVKGIYDAVESGSKTNIKL